MNNGKVRIYELSKELNLENKDILAVCERLDIPVKSHSSTITEEEAARIRKESENLPHQAKATGSHHGGHHATHASKSTEENTSHKTHKSSHSQAVATESQSEHHADPHTDAESTTAHDHKKQEILEVRKLKESQADQNHTEVDENIANTAEIASPPAQPTELLPPPAAPRHTTEKKSNTLLNTTEQTVTASDQTIPLPDQEKTPTNDLAKSVTTAKENVTSTEERPPKNRTSKGNKASAPKVQLVAPPVRPATPEKSSTETSANPTNTKPQPVSAKNQGKEEQTGGNGDNNGQKSSPTQKKNKPDQKLEGNKEKADATNETGEVTPPRPSPQKGSLVVNADGSLTNPNLNRDKNNRRDKDRSTRPKSATDEGGERIPQPAGRRDKPRNGERGTAPAGNNLVRNERLPELLLPKPQQPKKPGKAIGEDDTGLTVTVGDDNVETDVLDIDKPKRKGAIAPKAIPPKASAKRGGKWDEEEEDVIEVAKAKAAAKAKRPKAKSLLDEDIIIDEEDWDEETEGAISALPISLSLARPPKPKRQGGTTVQARPVTPGPTTKKPGHSHADRGNKVAAEVKQEKVEKLEVFGPMTVQEVASVLALPETEIIRKLFMKGVAVSITETLDMTALELIADDLGIPMEVVEKQSAAQKLTEMLDETDLEHLLRRPPVVTIMGHVDHGKTSLLDSIRATKVAQGEAGGITQHIGAYHVDVEHDGKTQQVVFLDTPGHEAFTAMRARGARVTDVAILVVAADDGVQPQTIEAISHAKAAGVPIIVAINKIDKEDANPDRVKQELMEQGLVPEEWGGDIIMVPVSAIKKQNLDTLLEMVLLVSEVEDLQANPDRAAKGTVIEAHLDKARGPVATFLVQNGTLRVGDIVVAGSAYGKVRAMIDDRGQRVEIAGPSFAVEVLGLRDVPQAGDEFDVFVNEKDASAIAQARADEKRESRLLRGRFSLSALSAKVKEGQLKELNLILKGDVQGSVEAIVESLRQLPQNEVQLRLLLAAPGEITETDIDLAAASNAVLIGFNTTFATGSRQAADRAGVDVRDYNIIYNLLDDVQAAMEGLLEPELIEEPLGQVEVRAVFAIGRGAVAGCYVLSGKIARNCKVRIKRNNQVIQESVLDSLKRMKDDVKEVNAGYECGISLDNFSDWQEGDIIEAYRLVTKRRTLSAEK
jgi:translation initiation factor IF-2